MRLDDDDLVIGIIVVLAFGFWSVSWTLERIFVPDVGVGSAPMAPLVALLVVWVYWFAVHYFDLNGRTEAVATDGGERR